MWKGGGEMKEDQTAKLDLGAGFSQNNVTSCQPLLQQKVYKIKHIARCQSSVGNLTKDDKLYISDRGPGSGQWPPGHECPLCNPVISQI